MTEQAFSLAVGTRIRERRDRLGLTQLQLAHAIGVKRSTVCAWEASSRNASAYHLSKLEGFFKKREHAVRSGDDDAR